MLNFEHFLEQYFTIAQFNLHFFLQEKVLLQTGQFFLGRSDFFITLEDVCFLEIKNKPLSHKKYLIKKTEV